MHQIQKILLRLKMKSTSTLWSALSWSFWQLRVCARRLKSMTSWFAWSACAICSRARQFLPLYLPLSTTYWTIRTQRSWSCCQYCLNSCWCVWPTRRRSCEWQAWSCWSLCLKPKGVRLTPLWCSSLKRSWQRTRSLGLRAPPIYQYRSSKTRRTFQISRRRNRRRLWIIRTVSASITWLRVCRNISSTPTRRSSRLTRKWKTWWPSTSRSRSRPQVSRAPSRTCTIMCWRRISASW